MAPRSTPESVDDYIASFPPEIREILQRIRRTVHEAAPGAEETISYGMPAFRLRGVLVYFAAFAHHIGLYPPVSGDAALKRTLAPYAGPKGNLRFPLDEPIPYRLISRIVKHRVRQDQARARGARTKTR